MSDIITRAKRLLEGVDELPWELRPNEEFVRDREGDPVVGEEVAGTTDEELRLIAAAPELAAALAQETHLYGVQVWVDDGWVMMLTSNYGTSLMHRGKWFVHKNEAEDFAEMWNRDTPTRIVRRRVSPVEVME